MLIKIDTRETALFQLILQQIANVPAYQNIKVHSETLPIGDIIINDETEDKLIIERKSINDLLASIKDGRYEEQSYRLNGLPHHNHNIVYLIEGDIGKPNRFKPENPQMAYSAMFSLNYYKGFSVFRSFSMEETATILCNMAYKLEKETLKGKTPFYQNKVQLEETTDISLNEEPVSTEKDYVNVIKKVKKENITPENIGEIMLCQIPGISSITALAIMEKYKTIQNLIKELELNGESMKDMTYTNSKGQMRKINKSSLANIVKYLC